MMNGDPLSSHESSPAAAENRAILQKTGNRAILQIWRESKNVPKVSVCPFVQQISGWPGEIQPAIGAGEKIPSVHPFSRWRLVPKEDSEQGVSSLFWATMAFALYLCVDPRAPATDAARVGP
jgi:hypothetical protein